VNAERELGKALQLEHTPTIYVVNSKSKSHPFIEVKEPSDQLFQTIDAVKAE
jgi:hypothetical protein